MTRDFSCLKTIISKLGLLMLLMAMSTSNFYANGGDGNDDDKKKSSNENCNLGLDIPERLLTISKNEKEVVFRDTKSNAVLTFTKVGLAAYDFDLEHNAHVMYQEIEDNPHFEGVEIRRKDLSVTECFILDWNNNESGPNLRNNYCTMALIEACGQYYNFTFTLPVKKRAEVLPVFSQILESVDKVQQ